MSNTTPMAESYEYTALVKIHDPQQLCVAALAHPQAVQAGMTQADFTDKHGQVDLAECLKMLLDPGHLPGCEFIDTTAEAL